MKNIDYEKVNKHLKEVTKLLIGVEIEIVIGVDLEFKPISFGNSGASFTLSYNGIVIPKPKALTKDEAYRTLIEGKTLFNITNQDSVRVCILNNKLMGLYEAIVGYSYEEMNWSYFDNNEWILDEKTK